MSNTARLRNIESNLDGLSKKVLHAMPVGEEITSQQVLRSLVDDGKSISMPGLQRSLMNLVEVGLASQPKAGIFIRRSIAEPSQKAERPVLSIASPATDTEQPGAQGTVFYSITDAKTTPLDRLAALAQNLRALASDIDDAILEAEEYMQGVKAETQKLAQLKELLKTL